MGKALEGDAVAISEIVRNGFRQGLELRHGVVSNCSYCEQMFYMRYNMDGFARNVNWAARAIAVHEAEMPDQLEPRDLVGSLHKGLDVLSILAAHPAGMTLTEMAAAAGLTRAGARRLLLTLVAAGYAAQDGRRFALTPRLLGLARQWLDGTSLWTYAEPHMRAVAAALKESCSAAVLSDADVVYVARVPGERIMSVALHVGTRLPAYCTSMGRVLLSGLTEVELEKFLGRAAIAKRTEKTVVDRGELGRADRPSRSARLCRRRRGTGDRPALDRRSDPRARRQDRCGDQRLDAVGTLHRRGDAARDPAAPADARQAKSRRSSPCSEAAGWSGRCGRRAGAGAATCRRARPI